MNLTRHQVGIWIVGMALIAAPARAQTDKPQGKPGLAVASPATTHTATGVVKRVSRSRSVVTLDQDPVASLGWPARTVTLPVRDAKVLERLTVGRKVSFEFKKEHEGYVLTGLR